MATNIIEKLGPYGNPSPPNWSLKLGPHEKIIGLNIRCGVIVDAIEFITVDQNQRITSKMFGGYSGSCHEIRFKENEYMMEISGSHRMSDKEHLVSSIKIHTNLHPNGYGPYGNLTPNEFSISLPSSPSDLVGFFGRQDTVLESIGAYIKPSILEVSSSSSSSSLSSLVHCGEMLAKLLHQKAKIREGYIRRTINGSRKKTEISSRGDSFIDKSLVEESIDKLLKDMKGAQLGSISQESTTNVVDIIEGLLQKLVVVDNAHAKSYEELVARVRIFKSQQKQSSTVAVVSPSPDDSSTSDLGAESEEQFMHKYQDLTDDEKRCLFYLCLFPGGAELEKRELIFWWLGMMSLPWNYEAVGDQILAKLVEQGFIHRLIRNNNLSSRYRIRASVRSKVLDHAAKDVSMHCVRHGSTQQISSFEMHYVGNKPYEAHTNPESIEALLNIGVHNFNAVTLDWLSKMKNALVLHLGSWRANHDDHNDPGYIVVEDIEPLEKALNHLGDEGEGEVRFLSLQGISGIVELPKAVYKLENLVVLDLRACNNLESLPDGIGSLRQLLHLDLSQCYLLEHIPKDIALLSKLRVLKGFIINPDSDPPQVSSCSLANLSQLKELRKLTIRSRRIDFPRKVDLETLCKMEELITLGIAWVDQSHGDLIEEYAGQFPVLLEKLELQAVPESVGAPLLELINEQITRLEKLYIRGALGNLELHNRIFIHVKQVRLRYLPQLRMDYNQFMHSFPNCTRLQIFECPNLTSFPCDNNGVWERKVGE